VNLAAAAPKRAHAATIAQLASQLKAHFAVL
jgi:hypothetical protein